MAYVRRLALDLSINFFANYKPLPVINVISGSIYHAWECQQLSSVDWATVMSRGHTHLAQSQTIRLLYNTVPTADEDNPDSTLPVNISTHPSMLYSISDISVPPKASISADFSDSTVFQR